jgi:ligand-binding sensor domain-containing protein
VQRCYLRENAVPMSSSFRSNCSIPVLSLISLLIALVSNSLALDPAQPLGQFRLVRWDEDQGLPQNLTPRIAQTGDGFLWLGFNHGLIRFDGKNFAVDNEIRANIKLPPDIFALLATPSGELWIASEGALYCRLANGEFRRFDTKDGLPSDFFNSLFLDSEGTLWIGTENHGLLQRKQNQFLNYPGSVDLSRKEIFCLCEAPGGVLWVGTAFGVYRVEKHPARSTGSRSLRVCLESRYTR